MFTLKKNVKRVELCGTLHNNVFLNSDWFKGTVIFRSQGVHCHRGRDFFVNDYFHGLIFLSFTEEQIYYIYFDGMTYLTLRGISAEVIVFVCKSSL